MVSLSGAAFRLIFVWTCVSISHPSVQILDCKREPLSRKKNPGTEQLREGSLAALECASVGLLMKRRVCLYCVYPPICHAAIAPPPGNPELMSYFQLPTATPIRRCMQATIISDRDLLQSFNDLESYQQTASVSSSS